MAATSIVLDRFVATPFIRPPQWVGMRFVQGMSKAPETAAAGARVQEPGGWKYITGQDSRHSQNMLVEAMLAVLCQSIMSCSAIFPRPNPLSRTRVP